MNEPKEASVAVHHPKKKQSNKKLIVIIGAILLIGISALLSYFAFRSTSTEGHIDSNKYQAVFFTNGQVYFGKLDTLAGGYMKLKDIYYLQTKAADSTNPQETAADTESDVELIKLGNEIHGPEDEMIISRDQVLFFENLTAEGKVTQSIRAYQSQKSS